MVNKDPFEDKHFQRMGNEFSFELLEINDTTVHAPEYINRIFVLDQSLTPDGAPTGVIHEKMKKTIPTETCQV